MRGDQQRADPLIRETVADARRGRQGANVDMMFSARAVLANGLGQYEDAVAATTEAGGPEDLGPVPWGHAELVEAAVRAGQVGVAAAAFERLATTTRPSGTDWGRGVEAARDALLATDEDNEALFREAIQRLGSTRMRVELARAHLLYGEWLRRQGRRTSARAHLRTCHDHCPSSGSTALPNVRAASSWPPARRCVSARSRQRTI